MSKKSNSAKNILFSQIKSKTFLSKLFKLNERNIFIKNNINALKYYKEFVKMQQKKTRNDKLSLDLLNINSHSNIEKFKNNPILILKSYDKFLFDEKKRKYKSQTLGVDEGLITLPKNYNPILNSPLIKNNFVLKKEEEEEKEEEEKKTLSERKGFKNVSELEKGCEKIKFKYNNFTRRNSEKKLHLNINNLKMNLETKLNYNFELKKLDNWDFLNARVEEKTNKDLLILNTKDFRRRSTLIDITNNNVNTDLKNMGLLLKTKSDKNKLKLISRIKNLKEFFSDFGKEQDVLLYAGKNKNTKNYLLSSFYEKDQYIYEEKKDFDSNAINYYKNILRAKKANEKMLQNELYKCAEAINLSKKEKEKYEKKLVLFYQNLKEINEKEINILNDIKVNRTSKDKMHINLNFQKAYSNETENERKLIRTLSEEGQYNNINTRDNNNLIESYNETSSLNYSSDKKILKKNYLLAYKRKNTIVYNTLSKIRKKRKSIVEGIKDFTIKLKEKQNNFKNAKDKFKEKVKFLTEYYYQILKKGLDVRKDGLSWVVVKLSELNAFIDMHHFPAFLSTSEINYLMKIGIKKYELNELIKLYQLLKNNQKKLKEDHIKEDRDEINKLREEKFNNLLKSKKGQKYNIGNNYAEYLEEIYRKYENVINIYLNEKAEEDNVKKISQKINKYVLNMKDDEIYDNGENNDNLYKYFFIPGSLSQYFEKDNKFRQYFDDIFYLNEEINKRRDQLKELKDNEIKKYKNLIKDTLNRNNDDIVFSERSKAYAALFGNNIPV